MCVHKGFFALGYRMHCLRQKMHIRRISKEDLLSYYLVQRLSEEMYLGRRLHNRTVDIFYLLDRLLKTVLFLRQSLCDSNYIL